MLNMKDSKYRKKKKKKNRLAVTKVVVASVEKDVKELSFSAMLFDNSSVEHKCCGQASVILPSLPQSS